MRSLTLRLPALGAIAMLGVACSDAPTAPENFALPSFAINVAVTPTRNNVVVCKVGSDASFDVNGSAFGTITDGNCATVISSATGEFSATVTENVPANTTLDSIVRIQWLGSPSGPSFPTAGDTTVITGTNSATAMYGLEYGTVLYFFNTPTPPPPGGGEGCTPGYWKQPQHFDSYPAPYTSTTLFNDVFADAFPGLTLPQVAAQGGGGLNALGRHTVAALLNAASSGVDYDLTVAQVIAMFDAAYASGDYETTKDIFAGYNEQGCPLN